MNGLYAILTVLLAGNIGLGLVGVAVHHGWLGAQAAFGVTLVNAFVRVWWPARDQLRISEKGRSLPPPPKGTRRRLFRRSFKLVAHGLFVMVLGYGWAHVLHPLSATLRVATGAVLVVCLIWFAWQRGMLVLRSLTEWPLLDTRDHPPRLSHLVWVTLAPFWAAPTTTFDEVLERPHAGINSPRRRCVGWTRRTAVFARRLRVVVPWFWAVTRIRPTTFTSCTSSFRTMGTSHA